MREILFRGAQRVDCAKSLIWYEGSLIIETDGYTGEKEYYIQNENGSYLVIPETVGQYTGLTDKNDKKIFEGDIIRYTDIDEYQYYLECKESPEDYDEKLFKNMWTVDDVVYGDKVGYPAFDLNSHNFECNGLSGLCESYQYFYEVIGNIHDNPELLKEADNE